MTKHEHAPRPSFPLGQVVATQGAMAECSMPHILACLHRHSQGDWGCIDTDDRALNDEAIILGNRILSAYPIDPVKPSEGHGDNTLWIITEADRSVTTLLLPDEY